MGGTRKLLQPVLGFVRESREELSLERSWWESRKAIVFPVLPSPIVGPQKSPYLG